MGPLFRFRNLHRETLLFGVALLALYAGIMLAKFTLWRANVLFDDWAFYNTSFWNTNFRDLWMFDHDRYVKFGYPSYLNEHFGPALLALAALYNVVPAPEAMLLLFHGATPIVAAMFIYATGLHLLDDRRLSLTLALSYALCPGILWPTVSMVYGSRPIAYWRPAQRQSAGRWRPTGSVFISLRSLWRSASKRTFPPMA